MSFHRHYLLLPINGEEVDAEVEFHFYTSSNGPWDFLPEYPELDIRRVEVHGVDVLAEMSNAEYDYMYSIILDTMVKDGA